jgi:hypothetical protein
MATLAAAPHLPYPDLAVDILGGKITGTAAFLLDRVHHAQDLAAKLQYDGNYAWKYWMKRRYVMIRIL